MFNNIRGKVQIRARSSNIYPFINSLRESNVICTNQHIKNDEFYFDIYRKSITDIESLAKNNNTEIFLEKKTGIIFKAIKYKKRLGIFVGAIFAILLVAYLSNTVIIIEVNGNKNVSKEEITTALKDYGVYKGRFIPDIDFKSVKNLLSVNLDNVAWVGIRHSGCRVVVDVDEIVEAPNQILSRIPCNIISTKNAKITQVKVHSGHLNPIIGDTIKEGEILISGVFTDYKGNVTSLHALGEVIGRYEEQAIFSQSFEEERREPDGGLVAKKFFEFFSYRVPLSFREIDFEDYEFDEQTKFYTLFGVELPFGITECKYQPYSIQQISFTEEEVDRILMEKVELYEKNFYNDEDIAILDRKIQRNVLDSKIEYIVNYKIEGNIGKEEEILIKN